tara:strand:+ start:2519 stop:3775 length:1257 start_codon:yes stop_codon:yes gene_type:complete
MANTITIGRMTFTSPASFDLSSVPNNQRNSMDRTASMSGRFVADSVTAAKLLRDELVSMGNSNLLLPLTYTGDTTFEGYCKLQNVSINHTKLATGVLDYSITILIQGRTSEMLFESNMSGALLTNSHSLTTSNTTYGPFHALPVNGYSYNHDNAPVAVTRATEDGNVTLFYKDTLRDKAAQWLVEPTNYYKGACKIYINNTLRTGYLAPNYPTGVLLSNGIIRLTSGSVSDESRFTLEFYDNGSWTSSREISFNAGSSTTDWNLWKTAQIIRNEPQECVVRFTSYSSDDNGDGRLTIDATVKRGAHHISFVANQGPTSNRAAASRINLQVTENGGTFSNSTGYMVEGSADTSGQKLIVGSPQGYTADTTNKLIHISTAQFKTFVGYVYGTSPANHDTANAVRDQYLESIYENVRLVRA